MKANAATMLVAGLLLSSCSAATPEPAATVVVTHSPETTSAVGDPTASLSADGGPQAPQPGPTSSPTWDQTALEQAQAAAEQAVLRYGAPNPDRDAWLQQMKPLVTPDLLTKLQQVRTELLPRLKNPHATISFNKANAFAATASVTTSGGGYRVVLLRGADHPGTWRATSIEPALPEGH